ncbi:peptidoglycan/LPS O-acetylase OafA/YrhL [Larkinella arboricola]|uniref:Peptidoglycan/LPS O-acetylase OafA/YrhL n=1 Tax=Larkinella arboricola TaxID=643671 RepID=A0A327WP44_LARAB|nr:acyltransferase [Larkinella arboricola]RAJ93984.1 peptidoglycan/LPS O-acetylase OafA/YrhL [Larkinella arboricola]
MANPQTIKHRFHVLDIFRGIFASMVVFFHLSPFADTPLLNNNFVENSDMFVDFFFVLSGFVITYSYPKISNGAELGGFIKKRLLRIYPLHVILLFCFLIIENIKLYFSTYIHINQPYNESNNVLTFFTSLFLVNSVKFPGIRDVSWNIPSWSISAEMICYLIFGGALVLLHKARLQSVKYAVLGSLPFLGLFILIAITGRSELNYSFDYGFLRGIIGFFTGSVCYYVFNKAYPVLSQIKASYFSFLEILTMLVLGLMIYYGTALKAIGFVYEFIFFLAILTFSFERGIISALLKKSGLLKNIGTYSYSIYMTHTLLLSLFNVVFIRLLKLPPSAYVYLVFLNYYLIYIVSRWTYNHIEMRFTKGIRLPQNNRNKVLSNSTHH